MSDGFARAQARMASFIAPTLIASTLAHVPRGALEDARPTTSARGPSPAKPPRPNLAFLGQTLRAVKSANARLEVARAFNSGAEPSPADAERARADEEAARRTRELEASAPLAAAGELSGTDDDERAEGERETGKDTRTKTGSGSTARRRAASKRVRRPRGGGKKRASKRTKTSADARTT